MAFGTTPKGSDGIPLGSVYVPGTAGSNLTTLQGGPATSDSNGNPSAPVALYLADGSNITQGQIGDAAVTGDNSGTLSAKLRGLAKVLADVWDSVNHIIFTADVEQVGYTAASSPPSVTTAGADTSYTFSSQVRRVILHNKTAANVYFAFDTTASPGSLLLAPGSLLVYSKRCSVLHLYTGAAQNINGAVDGNIVVLGAN